MRQVVIVGGGASGLMAAGSAAEGGARVILLEKKDRPGRKLAITGKGRCNVTSALEPEELLKQYPRNGKFLYSAIHQFSNRDMISFLETCGVPLKVERGHRVFPVSDQAEEVVSALVRWCRQKGVRILCRTAVKRIEKESRGAAYSVVYEGGSIDADAVILATGGLSYPGTGSTGDGYAFAKQFGHCITDLRPGLIPLTTQEAWVTQLQGLSLKNIQLTAFQEDGKKINEEFGEMLFTHFGISGPIVLSMSRDIGEYMHRHKKHVRMQLDLKPALTEETLDKRLQRDFARYAKKQFKNVLSELLPSKLIPVFLALSGVAPEKSCSEMTKSERREVLECLKRLSFTVTGCRPIKEAIVTCGGVSIKEINPKTMESKYAPGLYFAGELLDVDGYTGGFNLQAAFSTGYCAGRYAAQER